LRPVQGRGRRVRGAILVVAAGAAVSLIKSLPAFAEFEIPQVDAKRGGLEVEYRGASHWGLPDAIGDDDGIEALRQSHEVEIQYGLTDATSEFALKGFIGYEYF